MEWRTWPSSPEEIAKIQMESKAVTRPNDISFEDWVECRKESLRRQIQSLEHSIDICGDPNGVRSKVLEYKRTELGAIEGCLI